MMNVAEVDAYPIFDPVVLGQRSVAGDHVLLDHDAAAYSFDRTIENRNEAVAGGLDQPAVIFGDAGLDEAALDPLHAAVRSLLVDFHQPAVTGDIADDNRRKTPRGILRRLAALTRLEISDLAHGRDLVSSDRKKVQAHNDFCENYQIPCGTYHIAASEQAN